MVVTGSRVEAVRWQLAINKYIKDKGYPIKTLVAFSGEVNDKESGPDAFKETSTELNPNLKSELVNAIINALDAHTEMSSQALGSDETQKGLMEILLGPARLYEKLRESA